MQPFVIRDSDNDLFYWCTIGANGNETSTSKMYKRKWYCKRTIHAHVRHVLDAFSGGGDLSYPEHSLLIKDETKRRKKSKHERTTTATGLEVQQM